MRIIPFALATVLGSAAACPFMEGGEEATTEMKPQRLLRLSNNKDRQLQSRFAGTAQAAVAAARRDILNLINNRPRLGVSNVLNNLCLMDSTCLKVVCSAFVAAKVCPTCVS